MKAKKVDAYNDSSKEKGYMIMIQESKGKRYSKGLVDLDGKPFFTTDEQEAKWMVKEFNKNSL